MPYRFQIIVDSDSAMISQAPDLSKSRVILSNLDEHSLKQIAVSLLNAGLDHEFLNILNNEKKKYAENASIINNKRYLYHLFLGLDYTMNTVEESKLKDILSEYSDGFSISNAKGRFMGADEDALVIQIATKDSAAPYDCAKKLKNHFNQRSIGLVKLGEYERIT